LYNNAILDKQKANLDHSDEKYTELRTYLFNVEDELHSAFPNTEIALHLYLCLMVSNCTGEFFLSCTELRIIFEVQFGKKN